MLCQFGFLHSSGNLRITTCETDCQSKSQCLVVYISTALLFIIKEIPQDVSVVWAFYQTIIWFKNDLQRFAGISKKRWAEKYFTILYFLTFPIFLLIFLTFYFKIIDSQEVVKTVQSPVNIVPSFLNGDILYNCSIISKVENYCYYNTVNYRPCSVFTCICECMYSLMKFDSMYTLV